MIDGFLDMNILDGFLCFWSVRNYTVIQIRQLIIILLTQVELINN